VSSRNHSRLDLSVGYPFGYGPTNLTSALCDLSLPCGYRKREWQTAGCAVQRRHLLHVETQMVSGTGVSTIRLDPIGHEHLRRNLAGNNND